MRMRLMLSALIWLLATPALAARWSPPEMAGMLTEEAISEVSGLAASRQHAGLFWSHNDGGNRNELYAIDQTGQRRATLILRDIKNLDWEDLATFERDGKYYLLLADTGDNGGIRDQLQLIAIEEPAVLRPKQTVDVAWVQRFRWPDGARDCEAMAVDARRNEVLLISKKRVPPELFRLPLRGSDTVETAELLGYLQGIEQPSSTDLQANPVYGRYRSQITGADISPNGRVLTVLNYSSLYFYVRSPDVDWRTAATTRPPSRLALPWLPQAEAVAFAADGTSVLIASEQIPSPLLRYRVIH